MGAAFDAKSSSGGGTTSVTTKSWTHTPVKTPTGVSVEIHCGNSTTPPTAAVTYGGVSMTQGAGSPVLGGSREIVYMFQLQAPPAGAQTVVVTLSAARGFVAEAITYTGSRGFGTPVTASSAGSTIASATVACSVHDVVVDGMTQDGPGGVSGQTEQYATNYEVAGGVTDSGHGSTAPGAASVVMSYQFAGSLQWAIIAMAILGNQNEVEAVIEGS